MDTSNDSPLDDFYVTSLSKDEAVANLLGWRISSTYGNCSGRDLSEEEQEAAETLCFSVQEFLEDQRTPLENDLFEAKHAQLPEADIAEKKAALAKFDKKIDQAKLYLRAIDDELSKGEGRSALRIDKNRQGNADPYITVHSFNEWVRTKPNFGVQPASALFPSADQVAQPVSDKPWLVCNPTDPDPVQPWYTPARYFARELVLKHPTLLTKRKLLTQKVVPLLTAASILKRGKKPFDPGTVLKALSKVQLG